MQELLKQIIGNMDVVAFCVPLVLMNDKQMGRICPLTTAASRLVIA